MSLVEDKLYPLLPVFAQNWVISVYGSYWFQRRFGGVFHDELKKFKKRENYTSEQWRSFQTESLRKLLIHAFENVPFYYNKYKQHGYTLSDFEKFELEDLKKLPFLEKEELRKYGDSLLLARNMDKKGAFFSSSGSTGTPTKIYYSRTFHQTWSAAIEARVRNWAGLTYQNSRGMIGGRRVVKHATSPPPYYRYNIFEKQVYFSAYHISKNTAANYLQGIKKYKLDYMTGYAMSNYFLARFFDELKLEVPPLQAVITSSEKLTPEMRHTLKKTYNCDVFDSYSGVEACGLISENQQGELLISPDVGIMEVLDENGNEADPGQAGEVVSTGLLNFDQPLIRYRIGDRVQLSPQRVSISGMEMPVVQQIDGRVEDVVVGKDGRQMVRFHGLYLDIPGLVAAQIVQNSIDEIVFNLVVDPDFSKKSEKIIENRLFSQLGEVNVNFNYLQDIPRNRNGKFQAVVSKLN